MAFARRSRPGLDSGRDSRPVPTRTHTATEPASKEVALKFRRTPLENRASQTSRSLTCSDPTVCPAGPKSEWAKAAGAVSTGRVTGVPLLAFSAPAIFAAVTRNFGFVATNTSMDCAVHARRYSARQSAGVAAARSAATSRWAAAGVANTLPSTIELAIKPAIQSECQVAAVRTESS